MATLATLDALTLNHLQRSAADDSAMTTIIDASLNRWRREVWRRSGGLLESPVTANLVAGTASYDVATLNINAVSVLNAVGGTPSYLDVIQFSDLIERFPDYPGVTLTQAFTDADVSGASHTITITAHGFGETGATVKLLFLTTEGTAPTGLTTNTVYTFTITSADVLTYASISTAGSADFAGTLTKYSFATPSVYWVKPGITADKTTVCLHPIPDTSIANGLVVYGGAALADLAGATVSTLPEIFDTTATWFAAVEMLSGFLHQEDQDGTLLKKCAAQAKDGLESCQRYVRTADGTDWSITLSEGDHFGTHNRFGRSSYQQEGY